MPVDRDEVPFLHDVLDNDLSIQINKKNNIYSTFINTFNKGSGPIGKIKHRAFLLFWICHFFVCASLVVVVGEFAPYVLAILNRSYINIEALFLSLLYKGIFTIMSWMKSEESIKSVSGPFWFPQLWIQQYFPEFFAEATLTCTIQPVVYSDCYIRFPFLSLSAYGVANILVKMKV